MENIETESPISITLMAEGFMTKYFERFGVMGAMLVENAIYDAARALCDAWKGGCWSMYGIESEHDVGSTSMAVFLVPGMSSKKKVKVCSPNGYECELTPEALGIVSVLFATSRLSFSQRPWAEKVADWHHELREAVIGFHPETDHIIQLID